MTTATAGRIMAKNRVAAVASGSIWEMSAKTAAEQDTTLAERGRTMRLILLGVFLNAIAQLLLKVGMSNAGTLGFSLAELPQTVMRVFINYHVIGGLACYVVSVCVWLVVLSKVDVSYAYPMISLGYIFAAVMAHIFFHETLSPMRIAGIAVICVGVYCISRT